MKSLADLGLAPSSTLVVALVSFAIHLFKFCYSGNIVLLYLIERKYIHALTHPIQFIGLS